MKTAQGEAGEDVRMLQQGRDMTADDPQLRSLQSEADAASLGKDVGNAVFQRQGLDAVTKQYGPDSNEAKDATTVYNRKVLENQAPKPTDIAACAATLCSRPKTSTSPATFTARSSKCSRTGGPERHGRHLIHHLRWRRSSTQAASSGRLSPAKSKSIRARCRSRSNCTSAT